MKVIYWDVVSQDEIGKPEYRKEIEIADGLSGSEAAIAASEKVDALDFPGLAIGEVATNHFEVDGLLFCVEKTVAVSRTWRTLGEAPPTKQLALPLTSESPPAQTPMSVEDRVFRVIRGYAQGDFDLSSQTRLDSIFDSVGVIEMSIGLEGEFGFDFAEDHFEAWVTIDDVVKCVEKMLLSQGVVKPTPPIERQRPGVW